MDIADESDFNKKETDDYPKDDEIELDFSRHINCIECTSSKCYKIKGKPGYHCINCGWEGVYRIVHF